MSREPVAFGLPPYMVKIPRGSRSKVTRTRPDVPKKYLHYLVVRDQVLHVKAEEMPHQEQDVVRVINQNPARAAAGTAAGTGQPGAQPARTMFPNLRMPTAQSGDRAPVHARRVVSYRRKIEIEPYIGTVLMDRETNSYHVIIPRGFTFDGPASSRMEMVNFESALIHNFLYATHMYDKETTDEILEPWKNQGKSKQEWFDLSKTAWNDGYACRKTRVLNEQLISEIMIDIQKKYDIQSCRCEMM